MISKQMMGIISVGDNRTVLKIQKVVQCCQREVHLPFKLRYNILSSKKEACQIPLGFPSFLMLFTELKKYDFLFVRRIVHMGAIMYLKN